MSYFRRFDILLVFWIMFFIDRKNVDTSAINQQVEPVFPIYFASKLRIPSLERIERLSKSQ